MSTMRRLTTANRELELLVKELAVNVRRTHEALDAAIARASG
jgi:hypothetical protein